MVQKKRKRLDQWLNYRVRVTSNDGREYVGRFLATDQHMNLCLGECEEFRTLKPKVKGGEERLEKRTLGFTLLRGENIVHQTVEAPPQQKTVKRTAAAAVAMPGVVAPAGRGSSAVPLAAAPIGLAGPVPGVGGPGQNVMMPSGRGMAAASAMPVMHQPPGGMPPFGGMPGRGMPPGMPQGMPPPGVMPPGMFGRGGPPPMMGGMPPPGMPGRGMPFPQMPGRGMPPQMGRGMPPS